MQAGGSQRQQERVTLNFDGNDQLVSLAGDFMPGTSRDEQILGRDGSPEQAPTQQQDEPAAPGSLLEQIQRDVDNVETVPVPTPEPLETSPQ